MTCPSSACTKDGDPTALLCPVPVFIPLNCHPTLVLPSTIPTSHPESPQSACGGLHLTCSPTRSKLSSWGQTAAQEGTLCCSLSSQEQTVCLPSSVQHAPILHTTHPPKQGVFQGTWALAGPTGEPGANPFLVATPPVHTVLSLQAPPPAHSFILILPLGNFHFSSPLWMPTNSFSILIVCSKHPYSG